MINAQQIVGIMLKHPTSARGFKRYLRAAS